MAIIDIKLSQYAVDHQPNSALNAIFEGVERIMYTAAGNYQVYSSSKLSGSTLAFTYSDGAVATYSGFVEDRPGASSGTAIASAYQLLLKDSLVLSYDGKLDLDYSTTNAGLGVNGPNKGTVINDAGFATMLSTTDPNYDPALGNVSMRVKGALNLGDYYAIGGTLSDMSVTSEKNLLSVTINGDFQVSGNLQSDGSYTHSVISGTLTGYHQTYADGSHFDISNASATLTAPYMLGVRMLAQDSYFAGNDMIHVDLPSSLPEIYDMVAGDGDDQIWVSGGGGNLTVDGGGGNDRITVLSDGHMLRGEGGLDTVVLPGVRSDYEFQIPSPGGFIYVRDKSGTQDVLLEIERVEFSDTTVALDINGTAGEAYRLYQAAFARTPDKAGLGYWINVLDKGASLSDVAQGFVGSDEFKSIYGANSSNHDVAERFYQNILHRAPDQAGLDYWVAVLDNKVGTVAQVLMAMSESGENKAALIGVIGNGFEFIPYH